METTSELFTRPSAQWYSSVLTQADQNQPLIASVLVTRAITRVRCVLF